MTRVRISTTVDHGLLAEARAVQSCGNDASLMDQALRDQLARHRRVETDAAYERAYRELPADVADEWGASRCQWPVGGPRWWPSESPHPLLVSSVS